MFDHQSFFFPVADKKKEDIVPVFEELDFIENIYGVTNNYIFDIYGRSFLKEIIEHRLVLSMSSRFMDKR
jgi:hypothetical protein